MENINLDKIIKSEELDHNMILSVPEEIGLQLQRIIQGMATAQEKNSTRIEIIENTNEGMDIEASRKMILKINDILLPVTVLDLPCIIEAQKTMDNKTFYKSGDIAQMMFVHDQEFKLNTENEIEKFNPFHSGDQNFEKIIWKKDYDHKYKLKSGIGSGTRNIRAKRFKRKIRYNGEEILDVSKKLKSIIDNGAANFENLMKNKESAAESQMENQSIIHSTSEINMGHSNFMIPFNINSEMDNINTPTKIKFGNLTSNISINNTNKSMVNNPKQSISKRNKKSNNEFNVPINKKKINIDEDLVSGKFNFLLLGSSNLLNFTLPLQEEFDDDIFQNNNNDIKINSIMSSSNINLNNNLQPQPYPEEQKLMDEYMSLKYEYKKLKNALEKDNTDKEKSKRKKKIKKRIKEIKKVYKGAV